MKTVETMFLLGRTNYSRRGVCGLILTRCMRRLLKICASRTREGGCRGMDLETGGKNALASPGWEDGMCLSVCVCSIVLF